MKILTVLLALFTLTSGVLAQNLKLEKGATFVLRMGGIPGEDQASINGEYTVSDGGAISLTYLPTPITVAGLKQSQVARKIEQAYKVAKIFTRPTANVTISLQASSLAAKPITVTGEVRAPGRIPFTPGITMLDAISQAGSFTQFAKTKEVRLIRGNKTTVHNFKNISQDPSKNPKLQPDDKVLVPQSKW